MKTLMVLALMAVTGAATAAPTMGRLETTTLDGNTGYRCQLEGGKGYTIAVGLDTDQRLLSVELGGNLSFPKGATLKMTGPYTDVSVTDFGKAPTKSYELDTRGYDFSLTFTEGKAMPVLTLVFTGREFLCQ